MLVGWILMAGAAALLWAGAELFVEQAASAGHRLRVSGLAVWLLLAGAEPEELITAVVAAIRGRGGIAAGDAIGANVTMLTVVLGLAAFMGPLPVGGRVRRYLAGAAVLGGFAPVLLSGGVSRVEGLVLVVLYTLAVTAVWILEGTPPAIGELAELADGDSSVSGESGWSGPFLTIGGVAVMAAGGWLAVLGAEKLTDALEVADSVVGLSVVALATTAELFALVVAAHRHQVSELAVAGVVGSAGYNATATLGGAALVRPLSTTGVEVAAWLAAGLPLVVLALGGKGGRIKRSGGAALSAIYVVYLIVLARS